MKSCYSIPYPIVWVPTGQMLNSVVTVPTVGAASAALREAEAELSATEARLAIATNSIATTRSRMEQTSNHLVERASQRSALQTQKRHHVHPPSPSFSYPLFPLLVPGVLVEA